MQASAGLWPGTPFGVRCPYSAGLRPANGLQSPVHCGIVCIMGPHWRGTHDQWLVMRLNPVPVAIGVFDALFCGSALLGLKFLPRPSSWVWDRSVFGFLHTVALFRLSRSLRFSSLACVLACPRCFPVSLDSSHVLNNNNTRYKLAAPRICFFWPRFVTRLLTPRSRKSGYGLLECRL